MLDQTVAVDVWHRYHSVVHTAVEEQKGWRDPYPVHLRKGSGSHGSLAAVTAIAAATNDDEYADAATDLNVTTTNDGATTTTYYAVTSNDAVTTANVSTVVAATDGSICLIVSSAAAIGLPLVATVIRNLWDLCLVSNSVCQPTEQHGHANDVSG